MDRTNVSGTRCRSPSCGLPKHCSRPKVGTALLSTHQPPARYPPLVTPLRFGLVVRLSSCSPLRAEALGRASGRWAVVGSQCGATCPRRRHVDRRWALWQQGGPVAGTKPGAPASGPAQAGGHDIATDGGRQVGQVAVQDRQHISPRAPKRWKGERRSTAQAEATNVERHLRHTSSGVKQSGAPSKSDRHLNTASPCEGADGLQQGVLLDAEST